MLMWIQSRYRAFPWLPGPLFLTFGNHTRHTPTTIPCLHVHAVTSVHGLSPTCLLSMGLSRQEYWSGLPSPPPWDLADPGIKPASLMTSALSGRFFTTSTTWEAIFIISRKLYKRSHIICNISDWLFSAQLSEYSSGLLSISLVHSFYCWVIFHCVNVPQIV